MPVTVDVIEILTADLAATLRFYADLGLPVPENAEGEPHVEIPLGNGLRLAVDTEATIASYDPAFMPPSGRGRLALALRADTPAEVDEIHLRMTSAGHRSHLAPWDAFWGQRYASLIDPNDVQIDLYCPLQ